ncbi:hypothetical protein [Mucilaginibacter myungsuensis]|uniref:Uncharacterized protein n=1 Tax=Mucilaginibacter myungsuensis TaxID=649104 RepID=A0A929PVZ8_9SPHI|nr:hypothetical protein [Mucilaginibacter myungsuensis]MBE9661551.1 hypothetical protein [Mucilaginibacter myungsuensis]MDN3597694.1 hypothetical protein [Mucilaginibacter myungsuensis]
MRYLVIILLATISVSCKKEELPTDNKEFVGTWRAAYGVGGVIGSRQPVPKDTVILFQLNADNTYRSIYNGRLLAKGKYWIGPGQDNRNNEKIIMYGLGGFSQRIAVQHDTLFIGHIYPTAPGVIYVRQR